MRMWMGTRTRNERRLTVAVEAGEVNWIAAVAAGVVVQDVAVSASSRPDAQLN